MSIIKHVRQEVFDLFPKVADNRATVYCTSGWIFSNHLEPMIDIAKKLCAKYGGDEEICELACLLHDVGLVYKREGASPKGHESRSLDYAYNILKKYDASKELIDSVLGCIKVTEVDNEPSNINEKIVRSADILSQFWSMHFFAKAHFYEKWELYLEFFEKKVDKSFKKICFEDERKEIEPMREYFKDLINQYHKYNKNSPIHLR
ncbi:MAG: HD domain-containing protein [Candidatus Woesearchaeota archaeon]